MNWIAPYFLVLALLFSGCAGYQLGGAKPPSLARVRSVEIPMFRNLTQHPRAEVLASSAVASALVADGTYQLAHGSKADAVLDGTVESIRYSPLRGSRFDTLLPEELIHEVQLQWQLRDARDPTVVLASGTSIGRSSFFADANLQTARHNALPDALERASRQLVARLANGY